MTESNVISGISLVGIKQHKYSIIKEMNIGILTSRKKYVLTLILNMFYVT
ncbi:MAG: hypothetical protein RL662_886 [Bacteroidota bacterium]|jgi:hypothetical protein